VEPGGFACPWSAQSTDRLKEWREMINRRQRFKIEAVKPPKQDPQERVHNFNEVSQPYTPERAIG